MQQNLEFSINELKNQLQKFSIEENKTEIIDSLFFEINKIKPDAFKYKKRNLKWLDFFFLLELVINFLTNVKEKNIEVFIFFDEVAWFDNKSYFINSFANYWNLNFYLKQKLNIF